MGKVKRTLTKDEVGLIGKYTDRITPLRGQFLTNSAEIESILGDTIAFHFFPDNRTKRDSFTSLMIHESGIQFHVKIRLFIKILKLYHEKLFQKYKDLEEQLEKVKEFRNVLAHSRLNVEPNYIKKHPDLFRFEHYKDGKREFRIITIEFFRDRLNISGNVWKILLKIQHEFAESKS